MSRLTLASSPEIQVSVLARANQLFEEHRQAIFQSTDRLFCSLLAFQWFAAISAALWLSPFTWEGSQRAIHIHIWAAVLLGGAIISVPIAMVYLRPGQAITRHLVGIAQMLMGALLIHLLGGRLETHFHVFGSLAFLAFYRDWRVLVSASAVVAADHFLRGMYWPRSVYGVYAASEWRWLEHAGWVVFEDLFLILACIRGVSEMRSIAERQAQLEATRARIEEKVMERTAQLESLNKAFQATAAEARESEEKYRHTLNAAADAIIGVDKAGMITEFSRAAETILGYQRAEVIGMPFSTIIPERLRAGLQQRLLAFLTIDKQQMSNSHGMELYGLAKDGREVLLEVSFSLLEAGPRKYLTAVLRDITERKRAEEESQRMHEENQRLLASIPSILISFDDHGRITKWNRAAFDAFGVPSAQAIGKCLNELPISWKHDQLSHCIEDCLATGRSASLDEVALRRPNGEPAFLSISIAQVFGRAGDLQGILLLGTDITERRNLETQLAHSQKLESIGQLAAGIAHEINTPIQYVGDNITFLQQAFGDIQQVLDKQQWLLSQTKNSVLDKDAIAEVESVIARADLEYLTDEVPKAIDQSLEGVSRVAKIVSAMKEFSHPGNEGKVAVDVNKLIENTIAVAHNEWKYVANLTTALDPALPLVPCITGEFNQVILNLIINAAHAIGDRLHGDASHKGQIIISTHALPGEVEVRVKDTGTGIPEEARSKVFYPFFTTKPIGKGTGQGLAIAHNVIVKKHGGTLTFETQIGEGTTFYIRLPLPAETNLGSSLNGLSSGTFASYTPPALTTR